MSKTANEITQEIINHINGCTGKYYSDYYAGISRNPKDRLFNEHHVDENNGCWIFRKAINIAHARAAEKELLAKGMKGGDGGGDGTSIYVYAYLVTATTVE
ncbi:hypothetical protein [Draconibacterium sediminis]|uniref:hypothetical protein n=1 Tax=Draconibacterium sediminis TaxID=1544798 RepID=UPI0026EF379A|nr:hypothetical protein [Draconibacterium sediminis]